MMAAFENTCRKESRTNPEGGLFLFVTLPEGYDAAELFRIAVKEDVAFVIGEAFHCDGSGKTPCASTSPLWKNRVQKKASAVWATPLRR